MVKRDGQFVGGRVLKRPARMPHPEKEESPEPEVDVDTGSITKQQRYVFDKDDVPLDIAKLHQQIRDEKKPRYPKN